MADMNGSSFCCNCEQYILRCTNQSVDQRPGQPKEPTMATRTFDRSFAFSPTRFRRVRRSENWMLIRGVFSALGEAFRAANDYQEMTQRGILPREAIRRVFETPAR